VPLPNETFRADEAARFDAHAKLFMLPIYRHFARQVTARKCFIERVLDIGAGSALFSIELAKKLDGTGQIYALDLSAEMLRLAQKNLDRMGLGDKIALLQASASSLPFAAGSIDLVVSNASLHSWRDPQAVFSEIKRVTGAHGLCLIRDNLRLPYPLAPLINLISSRKGMSLEQRQLWWRAIEASYTLPEARTLLSRSALKGARVSLNPASLDLTIFWRPG
jgi:ubiquinone/menaquinone biosynthesis C-methylase UbiE